MNVTTAIMAAAAMAPIMSRPPKFGGVTADVVKYTVKVGSCSTL